MDFATWLKEQDTEGEKAPLTIEGYTREIELYAKWYAQTHSGQALTPAAVSRIDVQQYRDELQTAKAAPATINRKLAALRAYIRYGQATGQIRADFNPLKRVKRVEQQDPGPRWLERKEQNRIVNDIETRIGGATTAFRRQQATLDAALVTLMRYAGVRVAELCALTIGDVQLDAEYGEVVVRYGKRGKKRTVPLHGEAIEAVRAWLAVRPNGGDDYLFIGKRGEPMRPRGVQRRLEQIGQRTGVAVTPHTLRHTCAKELLRSGAHLDEIRDVLGHANLNVTAIYTKPDANDLRRAVERMP